MPLIAVVAAALAAWGGASRAGLTVGNWSIPVLAYGLCLVPGAVAAVRWPARRPLRLPESIVAVRGSRLTSLAIGAAAAVAGYRVISGVGGGWATLSTLSLLGVVGLSAFWPRPGALRASVLLVGASLVGPGPSLAEPAPLVAVVAASAVALLASSYLAADAMQRFGEPAPDRGRRLPAHAAGVFVVAMVGGVVAANLVPTSWSISPGGTSVGVPSTSWPWSFGRRGGRSAAEAVTYQDQLDVSGRPGKPSRRIVLRVEAAEPDLWRTQTYDRWDGRSWSESPEMATATTIRGANLSVALHPSRRQSTTPSRQRITVEARALEVLAAAPDPFFVGLQAVSVNQLGSIRPQPPLPRGARYDVWSYAASATEQELRVTDQDPPHVRGVSAAPAFVQLPPTSDRVMALAREITAGARSSYDKARAVQAWLEANVRLTTSGAEGADVVDSLLFTARVATRTQMATAMAVLLRCVGVPARLAVGFLPGRRGLLGGELVVRASDAHTWVEAGFGTAGWQRFDPSGLLATAQREDSVLSRLERLARHLAPVAALAAALAGAFVARRLLVRRRAEEALPWVSRFWADLTKAGAVAGRPRQPPETPAEYAQALAGTALGDERLAEVGAIVTAAAYSGREPPPEARSWAEDVLADAMAASRRDRRRSRRRAPVNR